ncbi:MAG: GtrA family protein [Lachnospiraceae bacterium]|nr:GtrA family protein [Lachnospiraceae bacterium]
MEKTESKKNKLLMQILKFGVVGGISFVIDFVIYSLVLTVIKWDYGYLVAGVLGFSISLIFNYLASMKFVFERKEDADRKKEFIIFMLLSLVGLLLNTLVLWLCMDVTYENVGWVRDLTAFFHSWMLSIGITFIANPKELAAYVAKLVATAIVMVYNFITRKMILEKKDDKSE